MWQASKTFKVIIYRESLKFLKTSKIRIFLKELMLLNAVCDNVILMNGNIFSKKKKIHSFSLKFNRPSVLF